MWIAETLTLVSTTGAFLSVIYQCIKTYTYIKKGKPKIEISDRIKSVTDRIKSVTDVLSNSMDELDSLQKELEQRIKLVDKLKAEADQAEQIISMTEEQVNAIRKTLNQELQKEGKKSFWQGVAVNFVFFLLGAIASYIVSKYLV